MSTVYLVRHGQAGTRDAYDALSDLGHEQSRRLGDYMASQGLCFDRVIAGAMQRQRTTAVEAMAALKRSGLNVPPIEIDAEWNEFDLTGVLEKMGPRMAASDPDFARLYEDQQRLIPDKTAAVHRTWTQADMLVVRAWVLEQYEFEGESWAAFYKRILGALGRLLDHGGDERIAVFTSATPVGICAGAAVGADAGNTFKLAGAVYNAAYSKLRIKERQATLASFNNTPHLGEKRLLTMR